MLRSMTGYGTGSAMVGDFIVQINLQSVNSRYSEQRMRLSGILSSFEQTIRESLKNNFRRGDVSVQIELSTGEVQPYKLEVNTKIVLTYSDILKKLEVNGITTAPISLREVFSLDEAVRKVPDEEALKKIEKALEQALENASRNLEKMQILEGKNLEKDVLSGINIMEASLERIKIAEKALPLQVELKMETIGKHLASKIPDDRIAQEVALALARMDIHEEIIRLDSHIEQFRQTIEKEPPIGTKLNFIIQEMHREANTIASKSQASEIIKEVIEIKEQTERIREQLRNVQ